MKWMDIKFFKIVGRCNAFLMRCILYLHCSVLVRTVRWSLDKMIPVLVIWFFCIRRLLRLYIYFDIDFKNLQLNMK